jgi:hypothetical protein
MAKLNSGKWPTWRTILFSYMFISILYMFRATSCSSSGESTVSIQLLMYVTLCKWPCSSWSSFPTCILDGHLHRVTYTRSCIDTIDSPDDEHQVARNMLDWNKHIRKKKCASSWSFTRIIPRSRSTEHKNQIKVMIWRKCSQRSVRDVFCRVRSKWN